MSVIIFIPARYASSRFPGKPLAPLTGAGGEVRSLIRRSWDAAMRVSGVDRVAVATDDDRIAEHAAGFGADVVMTSTNARNGTERCAEAIRQTAGADIVVNLQGDAPLTPPWFVEALIDEMKADPSCGMATPVLRCDADALAGFIADRKAGRVGGTTAVLRSNNDAIYFSKEVLPYTADGWENGDTPEVWHHVGVYAYRAGALEAYMSWPEGPIEKREGLEQLRFIENGAPVRCVPVEARGAVFWELNNPEDTPRIEAALKAQGLE
ncbi:MAG: manno-octulosonate cytidylyltransferase [Pseudomonadota bacterium]